MKIKHMEITEFTFNEEEFETFRNFDAFIEKLLNDFQDYEKIGPANNTINSLSIIQDELWYLLNNVSLETEKN